MMCSSQPPISEQSHISGQGDSTTWRSYPKSQPEEVNYVINMGENIYSILIIKVGRIIPILNRELIKVEYKLESTASFISTFVYF